MGEEGIAVSTIALMRLIPGTGVWLLHRPSWVGLLGVCCGRGLLQEDFLDLPIALKRQKGRKKDGNSVLLGNAAE